MLRLILLLLCFFTINNSALFAQGKDISWAADGLSYYKTGTDGIVQIDPKTNKETMLVSKDKITPAGETTALKIQSFQLSADKSKWLLFTNTRQVWRYKTRGDYWVLNTANGQLYKLGAGLPGQSLMFAKFSPDGKNVAYVSGHNIYCEDVNTHLQRKLTADGTKKMINGTFDWAYEEEFGLRDGFRWSPDSRQIAFWQIDASKIKDYFMLNTTDSNYSMPIAIEYPKVGESPSPARLGVITINGVEYGG